MEKAGINKYKQVSLRREKLIFSGCSLSLNKYLPELWGGGAFSPGWLLKESQAHLTLYLLSLQQSCA